MDYCTLFPEGWWAYCCAAHDVAYATQAAKDIADQALLECVATSSSTPLLMLASSVISVTMYLGVRVFGGYFYRRNKLK